VETLSRGEGHWMTQPLRFGLVGTGHWARITHAPALASTDGIEFAAVWAATPAPRQTWRPPSTPRPS
jgi:hypothetical protein